MTRPTSANQFTGKTEIGLLLLCVNFDLKLNSIGVARGCSGCTRAPRAEKNFRRNLQGKEKLQVQPQAEQESIL